MVQADLALEMLRTNRQSDWVLWCRVWRLR